MAVAARVAQGHPASRVRKRTVSCPDCGEARIITYETLRRIERGDLSGRCARCPGEPPPEMPVSDADRKWWLKRFGVPARDLRDTSALDWIATHGVPEDLALVATGFARVH